MPPVIQPKKTPISPARKAAGKVLVGPKPKAVPAVKLPPGPRMPVGTPVKKQIGPQYLGPGQSGWNRQIGQVGRVTANPRTVRLGGIRAKSRGKAAGKKFLWR